MSNQQPDLADRIATSWIVGTGPNKALLRVQLANIVRQSLSGYCVVKREVLKEVRGALDKVTWATVEGEGGETQQGLFAALTKLNEILGGKQ